MARLIEYLLDAKEFNEEQLATQERWRSPLFEFVRVAKAHPSLKPLSASKAVQFISAEIKRQGGTLEVWFPESDDPAAELWDTWDRVIAIDEDPISFAWMKARKRPVGLRDCNSERYQLFVSLAYHLQVFRGTQAVMLPVKKLSAILGVDFRTISTYRKLAERHGLMTLKSGHTYTEKKASEFIFRTELFDSQTLAQIHWNQDKQDSQDNQDKQELQENKDKQDKQNKQESAQIEKNLLVKAETPKRITAFSGILSTAEMEEKKRQAFEIARRYSAEASASEQG